MNRRKLVMGLCVFTTVLTAVVTVQAQGRSQEALEKARQYLRANARAYGLSNSDQDLAVRSIREQGNRVVIRFDQLYRGLKVFEGEAILRVENDNVDVTNALRPDLNLDVQPSVSSGQAGATALRSVGVRGASVSRGNLEILPQGQRSSRDVLVWHLLVEAENDLDEPTSWDYFVDAKTNAVVWSFNSLKTEGALATATGKTMYSGNVSMDVTKGTSLYSLVNPNQGSNGGNSTNDMKGRRIGNGNAFTSPIASFGNNLLNNSDTNTAGADAHYGLANTWAFYKDTFGRNGIDNTGRKTYQRVHYGSKYENAFWNDSCFCMTYGDGASYFYPLVTLDIAGHEMTHGVTASEADLTYAGESGGLNESTSDIFGTMVEFFANSTSDTPDYWIGEKAIRSNYSGGVFSAKTALRFMDDPAKDGRSPACWSATIGNLDVHYSSGPSNHMFYLLSHGGTSKCNGNIVAGIGNDKAAKIWYRALTDHMTASTNYSGARLAALNAAASLYGNGSPEYNATAAAFSAINVN